MKILAFAIPLALATAACTPDPYEGQYDMTYDVLLSPAGGGATDARAGLTSVDVHAGQSDEYLVDLGGRFCRLEAVSTRSEQLGHPAYLDVRPQDCWYASPEGTYAMQVSGSAVVDDDDRLDIVLAGSFVDPVKGSPGSVTLELSESW
jgi:hypothetical protein